MKKASLTETKNNLSALVDRVRKGETVLILDRGKPVARLGPAAGEDLEDEERIARLERQGVLRRQHSSIPRELLEQEPPRGSEEGSIIDALVAERSTGR